MNIYHRFASQKAEEDIIEFWESEEIDDESSKAREGGEDLYLPHPPIKTKDCLSWDDIYTNMIYDSISRFKSMRGFNVRSGIGFEPMNNRTESIAIKEQDNIECLKTLNFEEKQELFELIEEKADEYLESTREVRKKLGLWTVSEFEYQTDNEDFVDSIWWTINELMDSNLLIKKERPLKWCPKCKLSPAATEKSLTQEDTDELLIKVSLNSEKKRYFLTYVQEIWKLPSSLNLAVHPDEEYAIVKSKTSEDDFEQWVLLKENVDDILSMTDVDDYKIQNIIQGEDLQGFSYVYPLREKISSKTDKYGQTGEIILLDEIPLDTTGIIPFVPYFDNVHWNTADERDLNKYNPLMMNGHFDGNMRDNKYSSLSAFESEQVILDDLESEGVLLAQIKSREDIQRCDACKSRLITYPKREWFFDARRVEEEYQEKLEEINVLPSNRNMDFKEWPVTRDNLWGHPFPRWECDCGKIFVPLDRSELEAYSAEEIDWPLHSSGISDLDLDCPDCDGKMDWTGKTIHPSFITSCSTWAQLGYPAGEEEYQSWWPGELFIGSEDEEISPVDESSALSLSLFGEGCTKNMMDLGTVVSEVGHDDVQNLVSSHGSDSLRVNLYSDNPPWVSRRVTAEDLKYMHPLVRVLKNLQMYFEEYLEKADIDLEDIKDKSFDEDITPDEEWILSRLQDVRQEMERTYSANRFDEAIDVLSGFVLDDFVQSYFITAKNRLDEEDGEQQPYILRLFYLVLDTVSKLILPISPFLAEDIYQTLDKEKKSVFLEDWPEEVYGDSNEILEREMEQVKNIIDKVHHVKRESELPEKWPLQKIVYKAKNPAAMDLIEKFENKIKEQAKVKKIETLHHDEEWGDVIIEAEPKKDVIRKSYQHWVSKIATMLNKKSPENIKEGMEKGGFEMGLEGQIVEIDPDMVKFTREMPEGYKEISLEDQEIYVDLRVNDEIWKEEIVREIKLRLKSMWLDLDLDEQDEIDVSIHADKDVFDAIEDNEEMLRKETGIRELELIDEEVYDKQYILEWDVNGLDVEIGIDPLFKTEVVEHLSKLPELDKEDAQIFYQAGYNSVDSLSEATADDFSGIENVDEELADVVVSSFEEEENEEEIEEPAEEVPEEELEKQAAESMEEESEEKWKKLPGDFSRSSTYLIKEENSNRSFEIFNELLGTDEKGLCVTRDYPDKIREEYDLEGVDMVWLSNVDREDVIRPKSLENLSLALEDFLAGTGGVILFNGMEYLITNNDFRTVLHLVQSIKDQVAINESILMIPVNPTILEENQLDQISGVVDDVIDSRP